MTNPDWNKSELILALDLYFGLNYGQMDGNHPRVIALSRLLSLMNESKGFTRSVNSVSLKLANFKRIDPAFKGQGMSRGGKLEEIVWNEYSADIKILKEVADDIRKEIFDLRKQKFMQWMGKSGKPDGDPYQRRTMEVYANQVQSTIFTEFSIDRNGISLYELTNPVELNEISKQLYADADSKRRRDLRSAFQCYARFVTETNDILTDNQVTTDEEGISRTEGGRKVYISYKAERDAGLRRKAIEFHGTSCKGCGFNFGDTYGEWGKGFIEVHHLIPLGKTKGNERLTNSVTDLVVLCANCHRMVHRKKGITLSVEELRKKIIGYDLTKI
jgi:predicted HNH restriction endonuclease